MLTFDLMYVTLTAQFLPPFLRNPRAQAHPPLPLSIFMSAEATKMSREWVKMHLISCRQLLVIHQTSHLTPHTSHLTPHTSHLTPHTSHLTLHTSHLTLHTSPSCSPYSTATATSWLCFLLHALPCGLGGKCHLFESDFSFMECSDHAM